MKNAFKQILLCFTCSMLVLTSCKKDDMEDDASRIEGNYKIESAVVVEEDGTEEESWATIISFFPCLDEVVYQFQDSKMMVNVPTGCTLDGGAFELEFELISDNDVTYVSDGNEFTLYVDDEEHRGEILSDTEIKIIVEEADSSTVAVRQEIYMKKQ